MVDVKGSKQKKQKSVCSKRKRKSIDQPPCASRCRTRSQRKLEAASNDKQVQDLPRNQQEDCGICLEPVKQRGMLDSCKHVFCASCILTWSKRSSSCPCCKREFNVIKKTDPRGKNIVSVHSVKRRSLRDTLDREEFQQRRRQIALRERQSRATHYHQGNRNHPEGFTRQLLTVHQLIRDNMTRVNSDLRGLQNNLYLLNMVQPNLFPFNVNLCNLNLPTFLTNINVTVNGSMTTDVAFAGYPPIDVQRQYNFGFSQQPPTHLDSQFSHFAESATHLVPNMVQRNQDGTGMLSPFPNPPMATPLMQQSQRMSHEWLQVATQQLRQIIHHPPVPPQNLPNLQHWPSQ